MSDFDPVIRNCRIAAGPPHITRSGRLFREVA